MTPTGHRPVTPTGLCNGGVTRTLHFDDRCAYLLVTDVTPAARHISTQVGGSSGRCRNTAARSWRIMRVVTIYSFSSDEPQRSESGDSAMMREDARTRRASLTPVTAATSDVLLRLVTASHEAEAGGGFVGARTRSMITMSYAGARRGADTCRIHFDRLSIDEVARTCSEVLDRTKTSRFMQDRIDLDVPDAPELDPLVALREYLAAGEALGVDLRNGYLYRALLASNGLVSSLPDAPLPVETFRRDIERLVRVAGLDTEGMHLSTGSMRQGWALDAGRRGCR